MSVLEIMREMNRESRLIGHPLVKEAVSIRVAYAKGIRLMAGLNEPLNETAVQRMNEMLNRLGLEEQDMREVEACVHQVDQSLMDIIVQATNTMERQMLFMLDLSIMASVIEGAKAPKEEMIDLYAELFNWTAERKTQVKNLSNSLLQGDVVSIIEKIEDINSTETVISNMAKEYFEYETKVYDALVNDDHVKTEDNDEDELNESSEAESLIEAIGECIDFVGDVMEAFFETVDEVAADSNDEEADDEVLRKVRECIQALKEAERNLMS